MNAVSARSTRRQEAVLKPTRIGALGALAALAACAPASASVPHTVQPGETLWSIAAANNMATSYVASFNGLSPDSNVVLGSTIQIPSSGEAAPTTSAPAPAGGAPEPLGGYTVQSGDTLTGIAARSGVSVQQLAWMNGLDADQPLLYGTALKLPPGAPGAGTTTTAAPQRVPQAAPYASPGHTSSSEVSSIAAQHGVSGPLASAVAYQESGFNNGVVSSANARGVMQVMPGTWDWVEQNLSGPLDPSSPQDNVKAGSLYLRQLLRDTGGDERMAVAAYYQGLGSVRAQGMLPETQRYVDNVMALRSRFGG
jgi:soluble lytic murein transglycosylase-like protein